MYEVLVEKANDGICIIQDGIIKYANPKVFEIGGYEKDEIIGKHFIQFIAPEEKEKVLQLYEKRTRGEKVEDIYETILIGKDGRRIFVQITVAIIDYEEHPAELVIIRDITEKKEMEKSLNRVRKNIVFWRKIAQMEYFLLLVINQYMPILPSSRFWVRNLSMI